MTGPKGNNVLFPRDPQDWEQEKWKWKWKTNEKFKYLQTQGQGETKLTVSCGTSH